MLNRTYSVIRIVHNTKKRLLSTAVKCNVEGKVPLFSIKESDPTKHTEKDIGKLYEVPKADVGLLDMTKWLPTMMRKQCSAFGKFMILIRKPMLELKNYCEQADYTKPINKYVLYGPKGIGKSMTICYALHYAYRKGYLTVHVPWPQMYFTFPKEFNPSPIHKGMYDLPIEAGMWLGEFKIRNKHIITQADLKTTKDYVWSPQDVTPAGSSLLDLIDFGINRIKYACAVMEVLSNEIKTASIENKCKTMVLCDGFNAFFTDFTNVRDTMNRTIPANKITIAQLFLNLTKYDWCNGAAVLTVDRLVNKSKTDLPGALLRTEGFEHLDPFIPIKMEGYSSEEFNAIIDYYEDRKFVKPLDADGRAELLAFSQGNPRQIYRHCSQLTYAW